MPDAPERVEIPKFEFEIWEAPDSDVYWVLRGGRAALKAIDGPQEGKYRSPRYGILDEGELRQLLQGAQNGMSADTVVKGCLRQCQYTAQALMKKNEAWWIHIDAILAFYEAVKGQSDQLIDAFIQKDPKLEAFRLPPINEDYKIAAQHMARMALRNALTKIEAKV